jgi:hypothetical protein
MAQSLVHLDEDLIAEGTRHFIIIDAGTAYNVQMGFKLKKICRVKYPLMMFPRLGTFMKIV